MLDLDKHEIDGFYLGKQLDERTKVFDSHGNEIIELSGFTVYAKENRVYCIHILLSEFYSKGSLYTGEIKKSDTVISNCQTITPKSVCSLFKEYIDHWDDDTEVNYQFVEKNIRAEFSWHWDTNELVPNYISLEYDN